MSCVSYPLPPHTLDDLKSVKLGMNINVSNLGRQYIMSICQGLMRICPFSSVDQSMSSVCDAVVCHFRKKGGSKRKRANKWLSSTVTTPEPDYFSSDSPEDDPTTQPIIPAVTLLQVSICQMQSLALVTQSAVNHPIPRRRRST